jgi:hypothetical protein
MTILRVVTAGLVSVNAAHIASGQGIIPVRALAPPTATSTEKIKSTGGLVQLPDGSVLVNDPSGHRLIVFDAALATFTTSASLNGAVGVPYPQTSGPLLPYLGDSSVMVDFSSYTLLVVDPHGNVGRAMAPVVLTDVINLISTTAGAPGFDSRGRLMYRVGFQRRPPLPEGAPLPPPATRDTFGIVRADFELRTVDTIASLTNPRQKSPLKSQAPNGQMITTAFLNPIPGALDDWAVLSDGSIAVVRGQDYHIDWLYADGTRASTPKMAFDWRPITEQEKSLKIDSVRRIVDSMTAKGRHYMTMYGSKLGEDGKMVPDTIFPVIDYVSTKDMPDYVPPIRARSLKPDRDGNVWILPTTSAHASGGLLYDVVNKKGEVFERVQLPPNRDIAGFGRGGIVYLTHLDGQTGYYIERTTIVGGTTLRQ